ncbi:hypothetical protein [Geodermatophilus amargosae]|nr:hypothetical protein [Geodermatophilus amargosae]
MGEHFALAAVRGLVANGNDLARFVSQCFDKIDQDRLRVILGWVSG